MTASNNTLPRFPLQLQRAEREPSVAGHDHPGLSPPTIRVSVLDRDVPTEPTKKMQVGRVVGLPEKYNPIAKPED
jgi:hypothetical protein